MKYKCIIFDFDGTLADSENSMLTVYNHLAQKHGYVTLAKEDISILKEKSIFDILSYLGITYKEAFSLLREGKKIIKEYIHEIKPFEKDVDKILSEVAGHCDIVGVISSNTKKNIKFFLNKYNIKVFDFVITSSLFNKEKKIKKIKRKYKLKSEEILYVGDEIRDVISSKNAGIDICCVEWGYNAAEFLSEGKPNYSIKSLSEIIDIIRN